MEGISVAGTGLAVVSIALQLADTFLKLHAFWSNIAGAPSDIKDLTLDLSLMRTVLQQIAHEAQHAEPDENLVLVMEECQAKISLLCGLIHSTEPGLSSKNTCVRTWAAFLATVKKKHILKYLQNLASLKVTLLTVQHKQSR